MNRFVVSTVLVAACGLAFAKLPPPDDAAKAKAAETTAKAAWQAKVDAYQLCKAQDKTAAQYMKTSGKTAAKETKPAPAAAAPGAGFRKAAACRRQSPASAG